MDRVHEVTAKLGRLMEMLDTSGADAMRLRGPVGGLEVLTRDEDWPTVTAEHGERPAVLELG